MSGVIIRISATVGWIVRVQTHSLIKAGAVAGVLEQLVNNSIVSGTSNLFVNMDPSYGDLGCLLSRLGGLLLGGLIIPGLLALGKARRFAAAMAEQHSHQSRNRRYHHRHYRRQT